MQEHVLATYSPPQAEVLLLLPCNLLQDSLTGENYDNEIVYEGF